MISGYVSERSQFWHFLCHEATDAEWCTWRLPSLRSTLPRINIPDATPQTCVLEDQTLSNPLLKTTFGSKIATVFIWAEIRLRSPRTMDVVMKEIHHTWSTTER